MPTPQTIYTTQKIFEATKFKDLRRTMTVHITAGGASVTTEVYHGNVNGVDIWVPATANANISASGTYTIVFGEKDTRITPVGAGTSFSIQ